MWQAKYRVALCTSCATVQRTASKIQQQLRRIAGGTGGLPSQTKQLLNAVDETAEESKGQNVCAAPTMRSKAEEVQKASKSPWGLPEKFHRVSYGLT